MPTADIEPEAAKNLFPSTAFTGELTKPGLAIGISGSLKISAEGVLVFEIEDLPFDQNTVPLSKAFSEDNERATAFSITGSTVTGWEINSDRFYLTGTRHRHDETGSWLSIKGQSGHTKIERLVETGQVDTALRHRVRGFECFGTLRADTPLGSAGMHGSHKIENWNAVNGALTIVANGTPEDLQKWREDAQKLSDHIMTVMSFAAGVKLSYPVTEFRHGQTHDVDVYSHTTQQRRRYPVFHFMELQPAFDLAISSYLKPQIAQNLNIAIGWLNVENPYQEVRFISAITALENLIASNLTLSQRRGLSLVKKLNLLLDTWQVPRGPITDGMIAEVINARNEIVHTGKYPPGAANDPDLHHRTMIAREIAIRLILTALGYSGTYLSFLAGYHTEKFRS